MLLKILGTLLVVALATCVAVLLYWRSRRTGHARPAPAAIPVAHVPNEDFSVILLELTVQLAYAVARAGGRVARKERAVIEEHVVRRCGQDQVLLNRARAFCTRYESAAIDVDRCLARIAAECSHSIRRELVELCLRVAAATNGTSKREKAILKRVSDRLEVPQLPAPPAAIPVAMPAAPMAVPVAVAVPAAPMPEQHRTALEIDPALPLTADLIRRQYHLLQERYAPAKLEAMGPDFVKMAEQKRAAAHTAAIALLAALGKELEPVPAAPPQDLRHNPDLDAMFGV